MELLTQISPMRSSTQQVYDWLHDRILRGNLPPGTRLSEVEVAGQVGVSRQPVREAFIRLTAVGLAEVRPQRGTYIARISVKAVLSTQRVREAVESDLIRKLAINVTDALIDDLRRQLEAQYRAAAQDDVQRFIQLDDDFHRSLAVAAGQVDVWDVLEGLKSQMNRLRYLTTHGVDQQRVMDQHLAIVEALAARDAGAAEQAMRRHLRKLLDDLPETVSARPELFSK